jgi:hypothetical protein
MIYHYTSLESLACILESRCLRFTRLDYVDDPKEYSFIKNGVNPAKYVFVSCWTESQEETIPQWKMYGNNGKGVRISINSNVFNIVQDDKHRLMFPFDYFKDKDFFIMPILGDNDQPFFKINYINDLRYAEDKMFLDDGIDFKKVAIYKGPEWSFQKECRFILYVFPKTIENKTYSPQDAILNHLYPYQKHLDIPICDTAYNSIQITLGPYSSFAEELILRSLLKKYLGHEYFNKSTFANS